MRPGDVTALRCFGRDLVLFRARSGVPGVLDRYCPHLGASLAHGGTVDGDTLRCPFHGWAFDSSGVCRHAPLVERIPPKARARAWPTVESNGLIHVWHHASGEPPPAGPPAFEHFVGRRYVRVGRATFPLKTHVQELCENGFDAAHFPLVHRTTLPTVELLREGDAFGTTLETQPMFGTRVLPVKSRIDILCYGLGLMRVQVRVPPWVSIFVFSFAVPIEAEEIVVRHVWIAETEPGPRGWLQRVAGWVAGQESMRQSRQDRVIWDNKVYLPRPALSDGDRLIGPFRAWARQFYSQSREDA